MASDSIGKPVLPPLLRVGDFEPSEADKVSFEYELAELVWGHIASQRIYPRSDRVAVKTYAPRRANGDFVATTYGPAGELRVLVGDMTGRGLAAAIAAQPVVDLFHSNASGEASGPDLLRTMNAEIRKILPPGYFCAGALLELSDNDSRFSVWNCGLPDIWLTSETGAHRRFSSQHPPLGVLSETDLQGLGAHGSRGNGQNFIFATDGIIKARGLKGAPYGESGLNQSVRLLHASSGLAEALHKDVMEFCWPKLPEDDATIVVVA